MDAAQVKFSESGKARRLRIALLVLLTTQLGLVGAFWAWELPRPHQVESGEAVVLTAVLGLEAGQPLYAHATGLPLAQNPYGPVFEWLCAKLPSLTSQPYLTGRMVSILSILGLGMLVAGWLRSRGAQWLDVLVVVALMLTAKPWILFGPLYRVDALAVALSTLGFLLAISPNRVRTAVSLGVFALAMSVKLTALAAPLAAFLYLWFAHRTRALWFLGGLAIFLSGPVLVLEAVTGGAYLFNASFGNAPSHWLKALELPSRISLSLLWLLAVALGLLRMGQKVGGEVRALLYYALSSLLVAAVFATNPLSSWNYLMEFYAALALLTGLLLARSSELDTSAGGRGRMLGLLAAHAALSLLISTHTVSTTARKILDYEVRYERAYERIEPLVGAGRTVLVLDSPEGRDVLNRLSTPNMVSLPTRVEQQPEIRELIERSLPGLSDVIILEGPALKERAPQANRE